MNRIAFIACSKTKSAQSCRAKEFYRGELFKKALRYCSLHFSCIYILSAKYGLVELDQILSPYEETLNNKSRQQRAIWSNRVKQQMRYKQIEGSEFWFFTGKKYCEFFEGEKPLAGLSLGNQLRFFKDREEKNIKKIF
jgi:hypothetical protein